MTMNITPLCVPVARRYDGCLALLLLLGGGLSSSAQQSTAPVTSGETAPKSEEIMVLSPFVVEADEDEGYVATSTLAGTRLRTELRDVGSAISVVTSQFLSDTASRSVEDLLVYTTNTEIGGVAGNNSGIGLGRSTDETGTFTRQNANSRVRGLGAADNTRDFFISDIPWDSYNTGRVDIQRGPNSILFGLGNPSGVVNASINQAAFRDSRKLELRFDSFSSFRTALDINEELLDQELAVRVSALDDQTKYRQKPAFNDDKRIYGALRYDPKFLAKGSARTTVRVNYERGDIDARRPRTLPPIDRITPWFDTGTWSVPANILQGKPESVYKNLDRAVFDNWLSTNYRSWIPTSNPSAEGRRNWVNAAGTSTSLNYVPGFVQDPDYQPNLSEWFYTGVLALMDGSTTGNPGAVGARGNLSTQGGLNRFGATDGNIDGLITGVWQAVAEPWKRLSYSGMPFGSSYRDPSLTDTGVFDFYNHLLDGDSRNSWRKFSVINLAVDQTFWDNRAGISLAADRQLYEDGQNSIVEERTQAITVDLNLTYPFGNLPNPNVGRPVVQGRGSGGGMNSQREEVRATGFVELRATDLVQQGRLSDALGRHIFTGLVSENTYDRQNFGWQRFLLDGAQASVLRDAATSTGQLTVAPVFYVGSDMRDRAAFPSASSLNLQPLQYAGTLDTLNLSYFDSTWKRSLDPANSNYVNPAAVWINPFNADPNVPGSGASTQSENPDNYVGWTTRGIRVLDAARPADRRQMYTSYSDNRMKINSRAFVWQGRMFGENIVPTFGYRKDSAKSYVFSANNSGVPGRAGIYDPVLNPTGTRYQNGLVMLDSPFLVRPTAPSRTLTTQNRSWSVVAHSPKFIRDLLPWGSSVSLTYNTSTNFNPNDAGRRNIFGEVIAPSSGKTRDVGVLVSMLDNRINFRAIKFKSSIKDITVGGPLGAIAQVESRGWASAKRMEAGLKGDLQFQGASHNIGTTVNGTFVQTDADRARQQALIDSILNNIPQDYFTAYNMPVNAETWRTATDLAVGPDNAQTVQDRIAEGWEYELNLRPVKNWSISANLSKITSVTSNNYLDIADFVLARDAVWSGLAGTIGEFNAASGTPVGQNWQRNVMLPFYAKLVTNGEKVQEMVPLRWNVVSNYSFGEGRLKGFNVGGGYRWEDKAAIGYKFKVETILGRLAEVPDLSQPVFGEALGSIDLWLGYERKIARGLTWKIQLNTRNVGQDSELIPIQAQPDGSFGVYRIRDGFSWSVTNTITF